MIRNNANKSELTLALLSGLLLGLSFPPMPSGILAFAGFIPLLIALDRQTGFRRKFFLLYSCFFVFHGITNWWVSSWQRESDPYLMVAGIALWLGHPVFFMLPVAGYLLIKNKLSRDVALWSLPFLWTAFEWLHGLGEASYPWLSIGYSQIYHRYWVQIADVGGVWGVSFIILLVNALGAQIYFAWQAEPAAFRTLLRRKYTLQRLGVAGLAILLPMLYSMFILNSYSDTKFTRRIRTAVIQPNINPWQKWNGDVDSQILLHKRIQDSLAKSFGSPELAVWSETSIPFFLLQPENEFYLQRIRGWLSNSQTALLTGFPDVYFFSPGDDIPASAKSFPNNPATRFETYNAALLLNSDGSRGIHHKMRLTPFAERVPYADALSFATSWLSWGVGISGYGLGRVQQPLRLRTDSDSALIGTVICIESIYPDFVRKFVAKGADMLTIITNDAWFDHTPGPMQHYAIGAMRAIENRRYIARCGNTGVSGFISPTGASLLEAPQYRTVGIVYDVPLLTSLSPYVRFGDWLPMLATLISLISLVRAWTIQFRSRR